jgi:hypothetical protein
MRRREGGRIKLIGEKRITNFENQDLIGEVS